MMDVMTTIECLKSEFSWVSVDCLEDILRTLDGDYDVARDMVKELFPNTVDTNSILFSDANVYLEITPEIFDRLHDRFGSTHGHHTLPYITKDFETSGSLLLPLDCNVALAIYQNIINFVKQSNQTFLNDDDVDGVDQDNANCELMNSSINPMEFIAIDSMANTESSNLKEIMELELVMKNSRKEYVKNLFERIQFGDTDLALKQEFFIEKKRDFLNGKFPGIHYTMLDKLFEINCFDLKETIKDIEAFFSFKLPNCYKHSLYSEISKRNNSQHHQRSLSPTSASSSSDVSSCHSNNIEHRFKSSIEDLVEQRQNLHIKIAHLQMKKIHFVNSKRYDVSLMYQCELAKLRTELLKISDDIIDIYINYTFPDDEMDLHGLVLRDVARIVPKVLTARQQQMGKGKVKFKIITGIGRNGVNYGAIRKYVHTFLLDKNVRFEYDGPGAFLVFITKSVPFQF